MQKTSFFRQLMFFYRPFLGRFMISWGFVALGTVMMMLFPYTFGKIIDSAVARDAGLIYIWTGIAIIVMFLGRIVTSYMEEAFGIRHIAFHITNKFRRLGLSHLNKLSVGQHQNQNSGLKQDIITSGGDGLKNLSNLVLSNLSFIVLQAIIGLLIFMFHSPVLAIINAVSLAIYIAVAIYSNKVMADDLDEITNLRNDSQKKYTDYIRNITLLLLNSNEKVGLKIYDESRDKFEKAAIPYWIKFIRISKVGDFIELINTGIVLAYSINLYLASTISVGDISVYLFWSKMTIGSVGSFNRIYKNLIEISIDIKKFFRFFEIQAEIIAPSEEVEWSSPEGSIKLRDLSFTYPNWSYFEQFEGDNKKKEEEPLAPTIKNLKLEIKPKEKVAFVGMSGAGKSTLISLLMRSYDPQQGQVLIDGIDIKDIDPNKLRKNIGLVEQDIQLMDDTLRTNLLIGLNGSSDSITDEELWEVMSRANIDKFKEKLTEGLDTKIGERGIKLSGGERQRVAIARALLRKAPIIIFDEATSSLDSENEHEIHEAMLSASKESTCIFIAHRLATVKNVDRIFVLDEGQIVGQGSHKELLQTCEIYKNLVKRQVVAF